MKRLLTQAAIGKLRPGDYLADTATPGLRVVANKTTRTFVYRFRDKGSGKLKQVTIGNAADVAIAEARDGVRALQQARKAGENPQRVFRQPLEEAVAENVKADYGIKQLIDDYAKEHLASTKRGAERERTLRADLRKWYGKEAAAVRRADVRQLIDEVKARAPNIAGRVLRELRAAYAHAEDRERVPKDTNPAAGIKPPKESRYVPRARAFTDGEWRAWLKWLPGSGMSDGVLDALRLVALTACRPGEATAARWRDIDLEATRPTWAIRARKRGGEHVVYLSKQAKALLARRRNGSEYVFPSPTRRDKPIRQHALVWAIANARSSSGIEHWTAHDIRRSAATLLQRQSARYEVLRRVLGHYSERSPTDIYARHAFDTEARAAWAQLGATLAKWGLR